MEIKNLANTNLSVIVKCLLQAFEGYFVKMPESVDYWRARFRGARVDFGLSFGVFDDGKLVAFIINGIDENDGKRTAFNTGTGVIASHRGQALVDRLYDFALPKFRAAGVKKCMLEVVEGNARAICVYERIGFHIKRHFLCFKGEIQVNPLAVRVERLELKTVFEATAATQHFCALDNCSSGLYIEGTYEAYGVRKNQQFIGYFIVKPENKNVAQLEASTENFPYLMAGIQQVLPEIKVNNVDARRKNYVQHLQDFGLVNIINQYEMEWEL